MTTLTKHQIRKYRADYTNERDEPETLIATVRHRAAR